MFNLKTKQVVVLTLILLALPGSADVEKAWQWAETLPKGAALPKFEAMDHLGNRYASTELIGETGMLLFLNRSTDW
jgi:hypothetical protein